MRVLSRSNEYMTIQKSNFRDPHTSHERNSLAVKINVKKIHLYAQIISL